MSRRRLAVILGTVAGLAGAFWASCHFGAVLGDMDVEAERASGRATAPIGGAREEGAQAVPTVAELERTTDRERLVEIAASMEAELRAGADRLPDGETHVLLATVYRLLDDMPRARAHADRGVNLLPSNSVARHVRAKALAADLLERGREDGWTAVLGSLGAIGEYKAELEAAIELDPSNLDARDEEIGVLLFTPWPVGNERRAMRRIEEIEFLDPLRGGLWRSQVAAKDDRHEEALAILEAVAPEAESEHERERVALVRGMLLQELDRFAEAAAAYAPLLDGERTPAYYQALYEGAKARQRGVIELEEAIRMLDEFIAAEPVGDFVPELAGAHYRRGLCLRDLGRFDEARAAFERTLALDPGFERAREALQTV